MAHKAPAVLNVYAAAATRVQRRWPMHGCVQGLCEMRPLLVDGDDEGISDPKAVCALHILDAV
jgi:hypothetical protein